MWVAVVKFHSAQCFFLLSEREESCILGDHGMLQYQLPQWYDLPDNLFSILVQITQELLAGIVRPFAEKFTQHRTM